MADPKLKLSTPFSGGKAAFNWNALSESIKNMREAKRESRNNSICGDDRGDALLPAPTPVQLQVPRRDGSTLYPQVSAPVHVSEEGGRSLAPERVISLSQTQERETSSPTFTMDHEHLDEALRGLRDVGDYLNELRVAIESFEEKNVAVKAGVKEQSHQVLSWLNEELGKLSKFEPADCETETLEEKVVEMMGAWSARQQEMREVAASRRELVSRVREEGSSMASRVGEVVREHGTRMEETLQIQLDELLQGVHERRQVAAQSASRLSSLVAHTTGLTDDLSDMWEDGAGGVMRGSEKQLEEMEKWLDSVLVNPSRAKMEE